MAKNKHLPLFMGNLICPMIKLYRQTILFSDFLLGNLFRACLTKNKVLSLSRSIILKFYCLTESS